MTDAAAAPSRRLTAIMFTDVVGYSELAHQNEPLALELLELHRGWVREILPRHGGREVETIGDAFLVEFSGALAAVECALAIQRRFAGYNAGAAPERRMQLRIGIHAGDVEHRDGKVMGDGVNIASRIHGLAEPGGVCVSEQVHAAVRTRPGYHFEGMGAPALKHIAAPPVLYRLRVDGAVPPRRLRMPAIAAALLVAGALAVAATVMWRLPSAPAAAPSVAVLPFENLSADPDNAFFTDGLHDTVIGHLARVKALRVISRTSVMGFRDRRGDLQEIARELDVTSIVEGSVQRTGGRLRVTAQLIDARTDAHLWSSEYEREVTDVFAVQADIARQVADAIHAQLTPQERERIERVPTTNPTAYDLYLKAALVERNWSQEGEARLFAAVDWCSQAVALDPQFAQAWAVLAYLHDALYWSGVDPSAARHRQAVTAAETALRLDPNLAEARVAIALIRYHERDYDAALREIDRALELAPGNGAAYMHQVAILRRTGQWTRALASGERGMRLDPLDPKMLEYHKGTVRVMRRHAEVDQVLARLERLAPDPRRIRLERAENRFYWTGDLKAFEEGVQQAADAPDDDCAVRTARVRLLSLQRKLAEAAATALSCPFDVPAAPNALWAAMLYWSAGDLPQARRFAARARTRLEQVAPGSPAPGLNQVRMAWVLAIEGDTAAAEQLIDKAIRATPLAFDAIAHPEVLRSAAELHAMMGNRERALQELAQALDLPNGGNAHEIRLQPEFASLRGDPRFQELIARHLPRN